MTAEKEQGAATAALATMPDTAPPAPVPSAAPVSAPATSNDASAHAMARAQSLNEHRKWLLGVDYESSVSFDKVLTTLSAGALGVSVSLGQGKALWLWALKLSWVFFTASLLSMLFSFRTARRELELQIRGVDWKLQHGDKQPFPKVRRPWYEVTTSALNTTALLCLILGICFLIAFAAMNV